MPLLRWIYPPPHYDLPPSLAELQLVLSAAHKYQMDGVVTTICSVLVDAWSKTEPLRVYAIATRFRLEAVAQAAARHFLSLPMSAANAYVDELEDISAAAYHRLCDYRRQCLAALADMTKNLTWFPDAGWAFKRSLPGCMCAIDPAGTKYRFKGDAVDHVLSTWFVGHCQRMASLLQDKPCREAIANEALYEEALKEGSNCPGCRPAIFTHLRLFASMMRTEIDARIAAVPLEVGY